MSKYDEMSVEQLEECAGNLGIDTCEYCKFHGDCPGGIRPDGGGNPVYPPCSDGDPEVYVDEDELRTLVEEASADA
jgi:hypothetical protein